MVSCWLPCGAHWLPLGSHRLPFGTLGHPLASLLALFGSLCGMDQRNENYTFGLSKTYDSEVLGGPLARPGAHLGNFLGPLAALFGSSVSRSTSSRHLSRPGPLLDPLFSAPGRPWGRKKKLHRSWGAFWAAEGKNLPQKEGNPKSMFGPFFGPIGNREAPGAQMDAGTLPVTLFTRFWIVFSSFLIDLNWIRGSFFGEFWIKVATSAGMPKWHSLFLPRTQARWRGSPSGNWIILCKII